MCDCEMPSVYAETIRTARKAHECVECDEVIPVGSQYTVTKGLWDGEWRTYKTCLTCKAIADKFVDCTGECYPIGELIQELHNCDFVENQGEEDGTPLWVSNMDWLKVESQSPLRVVALQKGDR